MSAAAIFNGYGKYEQNSDGQKGITLKHGGREFWLPFDEVTYIPDYTMREVDHDKSTADKEEESTLTYLTFVISGQRIAEELLETQLPVKNSEIGIILISNTPDKRLNEYATVSAGFDIEGRPLFTDIQKVRPSEHEIAEAHRRATAFKEQVIQEYFQSKRERMAGGAGRVFPSGIVKVFMDELGVKDIDDVSQKIATGAAANGMTPEAFIVAIQTIMAGQPAQLPGPSPVVPAPAAETTKKKSESLV